jgi:hypothetical protein
MQGKFGYCSNPRRPISAHSPSSEDAIRLMGPPIDLLGLGTHKKRLAANRKSSTDPDVTTTTAMLSTVHTAVDSTIGTRPAAEAVCSVRSLLDFDRFLVAMMNFWGQPASAA